MSVFAATLTGKGTGAISSIGLFGAGSEKIISRILKPSAKKISAPQLGDIAVGAIADDREIIDQVTVACEAPYSFVINCHGNPLIVEMIMALLERRGAELIGEEQLLAKILSAQHDADTIAVENKLTQSRALTIEGTKIIANQIEAGLGKKLKDWLDQIDSAPLDKIQNQARHILEASQKAALIIYGCKAVLLGPPNSGKSTLLNCLSGRQKAIVTDIKGTPRDWVSAACRIGPLSVELIDTAGLDEKLTAADTIEKTAQQTALRLLESADLVLLVLDSSQPAEKLDENLLAKIKDKKILTVLNKSDLSPKIDEKNLPSILSERVRISAKSGDCVEELKAKILRLCDVADFDLRAPLCVTERQKNLLNQLTTAESHDKAASIITELLNGRLAV